jgi:hypothetical protein
MRPLEFSIYLILPAALYSEVEEMNTGNCPGVKWYL